MATHAPEFEPAIEWAKSRLPIFRTMGFFARHGELDDTELLHDLLERPGNNALDRMDLVDDIRRRDPDVETCLIPGGHRQIEPGDREEDDDERRVPPEERCPLASLRQARNLKCDGAHRDEQDHGQGGASIIVGSKDFLDPRRAVEPFGPERGFARRDALERARRREEQREGRIHTALDLGRGV
jgi:hypothetical protein